MSDRVIEVPCSRCGHEWSVNLSRLDEEDVYVFKGEGREYRVTCPRCGTRNVVTIRFEEQKDE